jgi:hypothetical protein
MILLDSPEILAAIRRSLEIHVLPTIDDDFTRIQVDAALLALDEVAHRLEHGDPYIEANERMEARLADLAAEIRADSPELAGLLDTTLVDAGPVDDPRERNRILGEGLTGALQGAEPGVARLQQLLTEEVGRIAGEDSKWMCASAIDSLQ